MIVDLNEKPGVWFDLKEGGRVKLRVLTADDWKNIRKVTVKKVPFIAMVENRNQVFNQEVTDEDKQMEMIHDLSIVDWEGFVDKNQEPIPCTSDNKSKFMLLESPFFRDFVAEKLKMLRDADEGNSEEVRKNL
jgi:hypothetical protein